MSDQPSRISSAASPAQRSRISCLTSHPGFHLQRCQQRCRSALSATCSWTKIRGERMLLGLNVDIRRLRTGVIFLAATSSVFADRGAVRVWVRASYRLRRRGGSALRGVWCGLSDVAGCSVVHLYSCDRSHFCDTLSYT